MEDKLYFYVSHCFSLFFIVFPCYLLFSQCPLIIFHYLPMFLIVLLCFSLFLIVFHCLSLLSPVLSMSSHYLPLSSYVSHCPSMFSHVIPCFYAFSQENILILCFSNVSFLSSTVYCLLSRYKLLILLLPTLSSISFNASSRLLYVFMVFSSYP